MPSMSPTGTVCKSDLWNINHIKVDTKLQVKSIRESDDGDDTCISKRKNEESCNEKPVEVNLEETLIKLGESYLSHLISTNQSQRLSSSKTSNALPT
jgi:hypothetical protein